MNKIESKFYNGRLSHFEVFLKHSDEKIRSAKSLGSILGKIVIANSNVLDVGTGNGEYLHLAFDVAKIKQKLNLYLVEPSKSYIKKLKNLSFGKSEVEIFNGTWEKYKTNIKFDIIISSHVIYHINRKDWLRTFRKMQSLLKPGGYIILVVREKDDVYKFKNKFKPLFFGKAFKAISLDESLKVIRKSLPKLKIVKYKATSFLNFPIRQEDRISIIEFYLNKKWQDIPVPIKQKIENYIVKRKNIFKQIDGIALLKNI